ncbi:hypothetical protein [Rhizobium sp. GN54]|uniref:hypothetical protein n=1 Tax=Rhizobium sp. GN54 TaxID=2898150 RepID=UPI001E44EBF8|nr:hypothetical protein [Rhizobium sp. GN54]MCD2181812.1 hypothetical protein [Rhizobium sp. GN54]
MLDMLKAAVAAYVDFIGRVSGAMGLGASESAVSDKLTDAIIAGISTAVLAGIAYLGREAFNALRAGIEGRRIFRSAQVRYVFDARIWMRDFEKKFCPTEADKLLDLLVNGADDFRFNMASSKDGDSNELMQFIHWLESAEIYAIRQFLTYGELFDSMCGAISSEGFAKIEVGRKLSGLIKTIETGVDAYGYAEISLSTLGEKRNSVSWRYLQKLSALVLKLAVYEDRKHLVPPAEDFFAAAKSANPVTQPKHGWSPQEIQRFEKKARKKLAAALEKRG